jgi:hypothetical protein
VLGALVDIASTDGDLVSAIADLSVEVSGSVWRFTDLSLLRVGGRKSSLLIPGEANGAGTMLSFEDGPRCRESPSIGIGGLRRSGGTANGAGTGGISLWSPPAPTPGSGVIVRCEFGVILRSGNLPGIFGVPLIPFLERGGRLLVSSLRVAKES